MRLKRVQRGLHQAIDVGRHRDVGLDDDGLHADRLRLPRRPALAASALAL